MNPESQNIEYKESWRDEYIQWICGFANAQGGKIYLGVNDKCEVVGLSNSEKLLEDIPNKVRDLLGILIDVNLLEDKGRYYLELIIESSNEPEKVVSASPSEPSEVERENEFLKKVLEE